MKRFRIKKFKREIRDYWKSREYQKKTKIKNENTIKLTRCENDMHLLDSYWESQEFLENKNKKNKISYQILYLINYVYVIEGKNDEDAIKKFLSEYPQHSIISFKPLSTIRQRNREKIPYNFKK